MVAGHTLATSAQLAVASHSSGVGPLIVVIVVAVAFEVFCLVSVVRTEEVRYLPRWLWAIICLVSVPLGGIIYLTIGKAR
jgi:hypothetical protein